MTKPRFQGNSEFGRKLLVLPHSSPYHRLLLASPERYSTLNLKFQSPVTPLLLPAVGIPVEPSSISAAFEAPGASLPLHPFPMEALSPTAVSQYLAKNVAAGLVRQFEFDRLLHIASQAKLKRKRKASEAFFDQHIRCPSRKRRAKASPSQTSVCHSESTQPYGPEEDDSSSNGSLAPEEGEGGRDKSTPLYISKGNRSCTNKKWDAMFQRLLVYKVLNGDCLVPKCYDRDPKLGRWVSYQRKLNRTQALTKECKSRLNEIGFTFLVKHRDPWEKMFQQLLDFKKEHGHCLVPQSFEANRKLGKWVAAQRLNKKKLSTEQTELMAKIGFAWSPKQEAWNSMFQCLAEFADKHGHCNVPPTYEEGNPELSKWMQRQRKNERRLTSDRLERLTSIGFRF